MAGTKPCEKLKYSVTSQLRHKEIHRIDDGFFFFYLNRNHRLTVSILIIWLLLDKPIGKPRLSVGKQT